VTDEFFRQTFGKYANDIAFLPTSYQQAVSSFRSCFRRRPGHIILCAVR
jgi:hypothetical protein